MFAAFASASGDARRGALSKQLQTVRSQIGLCNLEHNDIASPKLLAGGATAWDDMTVKTTAAYSTTSATLGPYLMGAALVDGEISEETMTPRRYRDPYILSLIKKIRMEEDPAYTALRPGTLNCRLHRNHANVGFRMMRPLH